MTVKTIVLRGDVIEPPSDSTSGEYVPQPFETLPVPFSFEGVSEYTPVLIGGAIGYMVSKPENRLFMIILGALVGYFISRK